ncbi:MAG: DUF1697 domain-containing protein [Planctomycetes bacterium]|nr:DUF1697 domain-containing protein [Planctomycetota bacterium]
MATKRAPRTADAKPGRFVALLRGVNVGGRNKLPMAELRAVAERLGWRDVATYVQSGNLVFTATGSCDGLADRLANALAEHGDLQVPVVVLSAKAWRTAATSPPFADAAAERPNLLHLAFARTSPGKPVPGALQPYCTAGERVALHAGALAIDFASGVARAKLTTAVLDRAVGSPVTARNWNSVLAIAKLLGGDPEA